MCAIPVAKRAVLPMTLQMYRDLEQIVLPQGSFAAASDVHHHAARTRRCYTLRIASKDDEVVQTIDLMCEDYTLGERLHILVAPMAWRDKIVLTAAQRFLHMYCMDMCVDPQAACAGLGVLEARDEVRRVRAAATDSSGEGEASVPPDTLMKLKSVPHRGPVHVVQHALPACVRQAAPSGVQVGGEYASAAMGVGDVGSGVWCVERARGARNGFLVLLVLEVVYLALGAERVLDVEDTGYACRNLVVYDCLVVLADNVDTEFL
ncbi:hypothetical protein DFH11DRAFT_1831081 [Phellopilus nigrolimitatus]|nr:hypothetical protein DFH11DRAFT_1831081 [Phellopilus nigrolimitatus]